MKQERLDGLIEQAEAYFELIDRPDLSTSEQLRLKICSQTLESNNISDRADYDRLKAIQQETDKKISVLKNSFEKCRKLYEVYTDIAETYHNISRGDYISNLIAEKRREDEQQKNTIYKKPRGR